MPIPSVYHTILMKYLIYFPHKTMSIIIHAVLTVQSSIRESSWNNTENQFFECRGSSIARVEMEEKEQKLFLF